MDQWRTPRKNIDICRYYKTIQKKQEPGFTGLVDYQNEKTEYIVLLIHKNC